MTTTSAFSTIYKEMEQLDNVSLDTLIHKLQILRLSRNMNDEQKAEITLLKKINKVLPAFQQQKFELLNQKRLNQELSSTETSELIDIVADIEKIHTNRIKYLTQLSKLKNKSVPELMTSLRLNPIING
jgi:CBS-domain-containing membrane protein